LNEIPRKPPNKYRRAFDWRVSEGKDERPQNLTGIFRLATSDFPDILEDFLSISRKRQKNSTALARLQIHMLEELLVQEGAVKHYRQRLKDLQSVEMEGSTDREDEDLENGDETVAAEPRPESIETESTGDVSGDRTEEIQFAKSERFFYRIYGNAIRAIGDGIAWRALGYDRAVTRLLGERATKQHITSGGTVEELRVWSNHFDSGADIAILNALTNCLAIGDVTVVRSDGSVELVEVKSSKTKSSRKIRQKHAMDEVVTLLDTGEGQNEERNIRIEVLPTRPETYLDRVDELLEFAGKRGCAARKISDYLYVEAFDVRQLRSVDKLADLNEEIRTAVVSQWESRGDLVMPMSTLDAIAYTPNCAPFSIFPYGVRTTSAASGGIDSTTPGQVAVG
jgi:hypothetical protein